MSVKILNGALDVFKVERGGKPEETIILRGVIDPASFDEIKVDAYQREVLGVSKIRALMQAVETTTLPDVELGMRGEKHRVHTGEDKSEQYFLQDDVFVIDGLQRITAAKQLFREKTDAQMRIGAVVHFNTTFDWERERFRVLNQERTRLNVNVYLRNMRSDHESIDMIFHLSADKAFVLQNRIQWSQSMLRTQVMPAHLLCKVNGMLHSRFGPGRATQCNELASALDRTMGTVGRTTMRSNLITFFDVLEEAFGLRLIVYADRATHIKSTFLLALADVFTRHEDFWRGSRFFLEQDLRRKLGKFPVNDPSVMQLAGAGNSARAILYQMIVDHINSGKRSRRLKQSDGVEPVSPVSETQGQPVLTS